MFHTLITILEDIVNFEEKKNSNLQSCSIEDIIFSAFFKKHIRH